MNIYYKKSIEKLNMKIGQENNSKRKVNNEKEGNTWRQIPKDIREKISKKMKKPILTHGAELWTMTEKQKTK